MITPPPASQGVTKHGTAQVQTVSQAQELGQLVVTPLQVTCPLSPVEQSRSTPEQLEPEQLTEPEPQLAEQPAFGVIPDGPLFDAKMASYRAERTGPLAAEGFDATARLTGALPGV
jgi:hypothetical protein